MQSTRIRKRPLWVMGLLLSIATLTSCSSSIETNPEERRHLDSYLSETASRHISRQNRVAGALNDGTVSNTNGSTVTGGGTRGAGKTYRRTVSVSHDGSVKSVREGTLRRRDNSNRTSLDDTKPSSSSRGKRYLKGETDYYSIGVVSSSGKSSKSSKGSKNSGKGSGKGGSSSSKSSPDTPFIPIPVPLPTLPPIHRPTNPPTRAPTNDGACVEEMRLEFFQLSALVEANQDVIGTQFVFNDALFNPGTLDEFTNSRGTGVCSRHQNRVNFPDGRFVPGGGICIFSYTMRDSQGTVMQFSSSGDVFDGAVGVIMPITGGSRGLLGAYGEIELLPVNVVNDNFVANEGDFFQDPTGYLATATLFIPCSR